MSSNSLKLGLLLEFIPNHYSRDCPCQYCECNCHHFRLSQINNTKRKKKTHHETRPHNPIRRTLSQQLKGKTTENREDPLRWKIANEDLILIEREPPETKKTIPAKKSLVPQTSLPHLKKN